MYNYEIKEINGKQYKVYPNGSMLMFVPNRHPSLPKHAGIYLLTDNKTGLKYVGSSKNVNARAHNYTAKSRKELNQRGLFKLLSGDDLTFELLEDCKYLSDLDRLKLEYDYIIKLDTLYPKGLNVQLPRINKPIKDTSKPQKPKYKNKPYVNILSKCQ